MGKPYIDFGALKACVSMTQVLEHYGLMAQMRSIKNGESLEGPCPIHKGTKPDQFKVSTTKNCWNCFSDCKCGGNVLDFAEAAPPDPADRATHGLFAARRRVRPSGCAGAQAISLRSVRSTRLSLEWKTWTCTKRPFA
ncbi:MAG: CHC2 zinc finger domain-containing protein [Verrucomicrobiales bacterium]